MKRLVMIAALYLAFQAVTSPACAADSATPAAKKPAAAAKPAAAPAVKKTGDTLLITARLVEIPGKFAPNDLYNYVYVMKYRVLSVEKGAYSGQDILVGVYNPLIPRGQVKDKMAALAGGNVEKFEVGGKHKLVLITPIEKVWKDAVEDEYIDSELEKFYALKADVVR